MAMGDTSRAPIEAASFDDAAAAAAVDDAADAVDEGAAGASFSIAGWPTMTGGGVRDRSMRPQSTKGDWDQSFKTLKRREFIEAFEEWHNSVTHIALWGTLNA